MRISDWSSDVCSSDLLAVEDERRHAPMAGDLQRDLVGRDFGIEFLGVALRLGIEVGEVEPGAARGARQMVAKVPVARAAPDQLRHHVAKGESLAPDRKRKRLTSRYSCSTRIPSLDSK